MNKDDVLRIANDFAVWQVEPSEACFSEARLLDFAARLEAEWMKDVEPVAWYADGEVFPTKECVSIDNPQPLYLRPAIHEGMVLVPEEPVAWINDKLPHMTVRIKPHEGGNWVPVFPHPAIPEGMVLVPNELSAAMHDAMMLAPDYYTAYKAMIAAAKGEK
jgi:hypothetical protein